jgi:phosphoglycerol transferase MdoB-like AlkP superfamily enzyme
MGIFLHGLYLDVSFSAYISIFPFLLFLLQSIIKNLRIGKVLSVYTIFLVILISFLTVADLEMYRAWGFRLDSTALLYLKSPAEMTASASSAPIAILVIAFILLTGFFSWLYLSLFAKVISSPVNSIKILPVIFSLFLFLFLFVPIRGGFQQIPINQSDVYFSDKIFANHAAVNLPWNLVHSIFKRDFNRENPYHYFSEPVARQYLDSLYVPSKNLPPEILITKRPNIIFIILESYTSKFIGCLGGEQGVTPYIDKIAKEGMLFTHIYASGDRSEKGLVALLSGYPTQTTTSIVKTPSKTETLPHLNKILEQQGYHSSYYYGGELAFANIKSYLLNAGYDRLISKYNFDKKDYNSKWGVHDDVLLNRFIHDLKTEKQPFFSTLFTLSSHEPYEIPFKPEFKGNDETTQFKNSFNYTDKVIGNFIEQAKTQSWWNNTLIIMVADHGHRLPGNYSNDHPSKFKIPLILTGGALKLKNTVNNSIGSQTDIAFTLLQQMGLNTHAFKWSKNLLDTTARQFAFYIFNDGFGFVTSAGSITFDNVSRKIIYRDKGATVEQLNTGKAYMQLSFEDFLKR